MGAALGWLVGTVLAVTISLLLPSTGYVGLDCLIGFALGFTFSLGGIALGAMLDDF